MKTKIKYSILACLFTMLSGCSDFLDVSPNKTGSSSLYDMEQLVQLMGNPSIFNYRGSYLWVETLFAADECVIPSYYYQRGVCSAGSYQIANWNKEYYLTGSVESCSWKSIYRDMFTFNTVLEYLDKVAQTTPEDKQMVKGEALFGRAYFHFMAMVLYCKLDPKAPGIGYKADTDPAGIPKRETVQYTLEHILADLDAAEAALTAAGRTYFEPERNFRITLPTLYAFKARLMLYFGKYQEALAAAEKALAGNSTLADFTQDEYYEIEEPTQVKLLDKDEKVVGTLPYYEKTKLLSYGREAVTKDPELFLPMICDMYFSNRAVPISKSLYDLFDKEHDNRWIYFYNNNYMVAKSVFPQGLTVEDQAKIKPWEYHTYLRYVSSNGSSGKYYVIGMSVGEMMLIKAECLTRTGKAGEAQAVLQKLREIRFNDKTAADNISGNLEDVLKERRRELTSIFRWYDIKRLNYNDNANITITKTRHIDFDWEKPEETVTLAPNDDFYAIPIPYTEAVRMHWENN